MVQKMSNPIYLIGIDPGQTGGIAVLNDKGKVLLLESWPGDEVRAAAIVRKLALQRERGGYCDIKAALEKVSSQPREGVTSAFKFGVNFGAWRGILAAFEIEWREVRPQEWQKGLGLPAKKGTTPTEHKKAKATMAARMFPLKVDKLWGPRGGAIDGLADALMIADWLRRNG